MIEEYLAKWLELSKTSTGNFNAFVDLIVKEQFTKACPDESAVYLLLERGPKDLVELINYMGSAVLDCAQATVNSQEQDYSPA